jgi:ATP-binding cassette subfamily F protein 3
MIHINELSYIIGDRPLLNQLNWVINPKKRIGLIGPNGAGKTTLLNLLTGSLETTSGSISIPKNIQIGLLPQEEIHFEPKPILDIVLEGHEEILSVEQEIYRLEHILKEKQENHLIEKLGKLHDRYSILGGFLLESNAKKVLAGLGFTDEEFHKPIMEFSGGWRMRVHLARLLLQQPDFLLLDEPTNHLDLTSLEWLEEYLQSFPGTIILVSHDRMFLDRLATEIAELNNGKIKLYAGNYHFYEEKKQLEEEQLIKNYESQKAEKERLQKFIDRFRYKATKAAQVQSRVKMLEKMEVIELPQKAVEFSFKIKADIKSYNEVLAIKDLSFSYDKNQVFDHFNLNIVRGEKIALVGDNGEGKTSLTKLISGDLKPQAGSILIGDRVNIGYYAQHQTEALNLNKTIMEEIEETAAASFRTKLRDILGLFRFSGDDVNKPVKVLSGGEKARVSLAKILLSPCNFLIMDEPTNHLDIVSKKALEHALKGYDGTLLVISHDRYFLDQIVHRVIELKHHQLYDYPGNYSYYLAKRKLLAEPLVETLSKKNIGAKPNNTRKSKEQKRDEAESRKLISKERHSLQKRINEIEMMLEEKSKRKSDLENLLSDPVTYNDPFKGKNLVQEYNDLERQIELLEDEWEKKHTQLENLLSS